jgi:hypothetical protein
LNRWIIGSATGFLYGVSRIGIAMAVSVGLGGPAQAIMSSNSVYATLLAVFIDG